MAWKRWLAALLALILMLCPVSAAEEKEDVTPYLQKMIQYYRYHGSQAQREIELLLDYVRETEPRKGELWQKIMSDWAWCNEGMEINANVLPEGLPQDDSLCIVVLGYQLNADGSMQTELVRRLEVALASAKKYPNAYIAVSGGGTAGDSDVTEAGQMAWWLKNKGIAAERIIVEKNSYSTDQNAVNVYKLLKSEYPSVKNVAVVSSDYHLPWGCAMFTTLQHYYAFRGDTEIQFVGNAAYVTGAKSDTMFSQAWGISVITYTPYEEPEAIPALLLPEEEVVAPTVETLGPPTLAEVWTEPEAEQPAEDDTAQKPENKVFWWLLLPAAGIAGWIGLEVREASRRKKRKQSRQRKKMDL